MKKFAALLMTLTLVFAFAACGGDKDGGTNTPAPPAADAGTPDAGDAGADAGTPEAGTLTVWCWDPAFNIYAMEEAAKFYQQENPGFEINVVETPWNDLQIKLTTAATSGALDTLPDIFLCQNNAFQKNAINFPELFYDLTGKLPFDQFAKSAVDYSVVGGKNYGLPFDNGAAVTALRTDIIEEAGYTLDDFTDITWDKFIEMGKEVLAKTQKPLLSSIAGEPDLIMIMLQSCGASLFKEDGSVNIADNEPLREVLNVYTELVQSGVLVEMNNWDEYVGSFTNEVVAGTINGCWILGSVQTAEDQAGKWGVTNLPKLDGVSGATNYSANGGSSWAVSSSSQNADLAVDFLNKTFAGSVPFYEAILPSSGALANYLPAGDSAVYKEPQPFFGGEAIYSLITEYAGKVPSNITGVYYYEARDAAGVAMTQIVAGADADATLKAAEETVVFAMGG